MDRPENRLMYFDLGDDDDEYSAVFNMRGQFDYSPEQAYLRLDSGGSVDGYIPNLNIYRASSQETLSKLSVPDDRLGYLHASASVDEANERIASSPKRPRSGVFVAEPGRRSPRPPLVSSHSAYDADDVDFRFLSPNSANVSPGRSPPESPKIAQPVMFEDGVIVGRTASGKPIIRTDSQSSGEGVPVRIATTTGTGQRIYVLPNRTELVPITSDENQRRLNQRRISRNEKRYHTADAIQDMRKDARDKDSTIHKRLSWNFGTVDINIEGGEKGVLKHKTFSSDSLRSMPSSSGVSSTGSLHFSPETEIGEEYVVAKAPNPQIRYLNSHQHFHSQESPPEVQIEFRVNGQHSVSLLEPGSSLEELGHQTLTVQDRAVSKSMPDISKLNINLTKGETHDGITSIELPKDEDQRRKMSHAQVLRMKKQLLLNSTTEAS